MRRKRGPTNSFFPESLPSAFSCRHSGFVLSTPGIDLTLSPIYDKIYKITSITSRDVTSHHHSMTSYLYELLRFAFSSRHSFRNALSRMSIGEYEMAKTFEQLVPAPKGRFDGISRPYSPAEVEKLRGSVPIAYTLAEKGANRLWESLKSEPFVNSLGAVTGNQAMQQARAGSARDLPVGLAGRRRRQHRRRDVSGPEPLSGQCRPGTVPPHQPHLPARRPDRAFRRRRQDRLVRAYRRRRGSRLRRSAEFVRDHEGLYRGGRGRRSLRGPARLGKEVRPHGRQGADPDRGA